MYIGPFIEEKFAYTAKSIMDSANIPVNVVKNNKGFCVVLVNHPFLRYQVDKIFDVVERFDSLLTNDGGIFNR